MITDRGRQDLPPSRKPYIPGECRIPGASVADDLADTIPRRAPDVRAGRPDSSAELSRNTEAFRTQGLNTEEGAAPGPPFAMPQGAFAWPQIVAGFRLVEKVHQGHMSAVWRAVDETRHLTVALKLVPRHLAPVCDAPTLARLVRISSHPGLLTLIQHGVEGQWWYQVAEWVDGETLEARCARSGLPARNAGELRVWMTQLASALDALHGAGLVHGDVKPSNVLISAAGEARLLDLMALSAGASWNRHGGLTPAFASPGARSHAPVDPRDDVYSLATMIFHLLTGELPTRESATSIPALPPAGLSLPQWRALQAALAPERESRQGSAAALVSAIWPVPVGEPRRPQPAAAPTGRPGLVELDEAARPRRRNLGPGWGIAATVAALVCGVTLSHTGWRTTGLPALASAPGTAPHGVIAPVEAVESFEPAPEVAAQPDVATVARASPSRSAPVPLGGIDNHRDDRDRTAPQPLSAQPRREAAASAGTDGLAALGTPAAPAPEPTTAVPVERTSLGVPVLPERFYTAYAPPAVVHIPVVPERPDIPVVPERPDIPVVPERPDIPVVPERPDIPLVPERPDIPLVPERPDIPLVPELPDIPELPVRPDIPLIPERPEKPDKPERPDKPDRPLKP